MPQAAPASHLSKSETCLLPARHVAGFLLDDYDDLPPDNPRLPILPPKTKPRLPPKQKINKSQADLDAIDSKFRASLGELRTAAVHHGQSGGDDYDEPPPSPPPQLSESNAQNSSSVAVRRKSSAGFEDYDDPIHHAEAAAHEISQRSANEDYDDPIHHSAMQ